MTRRHLVAGAFALFAVAQGALAQGTRLLRHPAVSRDAISFEYGGDLWIVARGGGDARRLTSTPEMETDPAFSPDGARIAFSRTSGGNTDVCVVPAVGGEPKRLTFHPSADRVKGWTPDGRRIVFASDRVSVPQASYLRLFSVPVDGGVEEPLPMPRAFTGSYSPDGRRYAYEEITTAFISDWYETSMWRHYRGGRTQPVRIMTLADHAVERLPWRNSNDGAPMWVGNTIYFLSDRNFTTNLFSYRLDTKELKQITHHDDADIMTAGAGLDAIVYEQAGYIHIVDLASGSSRQLNIQVNGDFPWARPQLKKVAPMIRDAVLSPTGVRAAFAARGDIFTVPAEKGEARNLTRSSGAHDRSPVWSPDGTQLAWLSDASGEYQLMISDQLGNTKPRALALPAIGFYSDLAWSPDGKTLILHDNHLNLWLIDVASGRASKIDTDVFETPGRQFDAVWSPDSRWVAYTKSLDNHLRAIFVHSLADGKSFQLTDALADAVSPAFDAGGKYLYFLASTDYGPRTGWLEMSSLDRPARRSAYLVVLSADEPSPLLPESSEEPGVPPPTPAPAKPRVDSGVRVEKPAARIVVRIDEHGIRQRILTIGIPPGDFSDLTAGAAGSFFYTEAETPTGPGAGGSLKLQRYQLKERAAAAFLEGIRSYSLSADKKKVLYSAGIGGAARWGVVSTERAAKVGDGPLNVAQLEMWVDPPVEWAAIFRESWRTQRDFFYDARMHGADWQSVLARYSALLPYVRHRADLGYLVAQTGGELGVGHSYLAGRGDEPAETPVSVGLLGADYTVENAHYRIHRIYSGENWNPDLRAPLSEPGVHVSVGDYLLEVDGRAVAPPMNVYEPFAGTAGHQVIIRVNGVPTLEGSRLVTVIPVPSESGLRTRAWIEDNRRKVDELSGGRLAYVWLPNTSTPGYAAFTRYFYAQQNKDGAIIDERYNQGGFVADYIVNELDRKQMGYFALRSGQPWTSPGAGIYGPKVMLINESAGSGGDALPFYFRQRQLGPLVGTRTWGGLVGTTGTPPTIDGGGITAPSLAFYNLKGEWAVENEGVAPDIEVENTATDVINGHDPQLERAVQEAMRLLQQSPTHRVPRPAPIDRVSGRASPR
jgi:tricorn protease